MGKYFTVATNSIKKNLVYRANSFIMMISVFFSFVVLFYFWNSIYRQGNQIGTYTLTEIISYYVFMTIFELLMIGDNTAWSIGDEINNGQITNSVLKPINYLKYKFSQAIGGLIFRMMIFVPAIVAVLFLLKNYLAYVEYPMVYIIFAISALMSYVLYFLIYFTVGIIAFWTIDAYGFFYSCFIIISFMQGGWLPLDLLPGWFLQISNYLPFKYLFFVPVSVVTGRVSFDWTMIVTPLAWCLGLYIFGQFLYVKGMKKYEGAGV